MELWGDTGWEVGMCVCGMWWLRVQASLLLCAVSER